MYQFEFINGSMDNTVKKILRRENGQGMQEASLYYVLRSSFFVNLKQLYKIMSITKTDLVRIADYCSFNMINAVL